MEAGQEQAGHPPTQSQLSALRAPRPPWPFSASSPKDIPEDLALPWVQGLGSPRAGSRMSLLWEPQACLPLSPWFNEHISLFSN